MAEAYCFSQAWKLLSEKYDFDREFSPSDVCKSCLSRYVGKLRASDDIKQASFRSFYFSIILVSLLLCAKDELLIYFLQIVIVV